MNEEMATVIRPDETSKTSPCPACRGRGIKLRDSRRALLIGDTDGDQISSEERECLD
ncbi:hypothetical protein [Nonomuraea cavernae]|uniref:Uncharacterized protein n=1 Tax=Nonomuraea cavernae TaxID=2045107 RepID=A0A917ZC06_9ACTN|nr:hypothetical protein [Nonomuraea cavernae]MCA2187558.1 hypothetical protein [Nonomuraea cavernae]GGO80241.1 hypothetical protein GCM10012289_66410 [Nonomuraea cavernae]